MTERPFGAADEGTGLPETPPPSGGGRILLLLIGLGISALFLWLTLRKVELGAVRDALAQLSLPILSLALVTRGLGFLAMGLRSRATVAPGGRVSYRTLTLSHLLGYTGNNLLPFRLGEILRVDYLAREGNLSRTFLVGTLAVERLMDSLVLLALFAVTVPLVLEEGLAGGSFPYLLGLTLLALGVGVTAVLWKGLPRLVGGVFRPLGARMAMWADSESSTVRASSLE